MSDFVPSPPEFNLFFSDEEGNIDFKNRDQQSGLWSKEKNGKVYWTGKIKGTNRRFVMFRNERKNEEPEW